jgi:hypothetical protein
MSPTGWLFVALAAQFVLGAVAVVVVVPRLVMRLARREHLAMQAALYGVRARWWQSERSIRKACADVALGITARAAAEVKAGLRPPVGVRVDRDAN